MSSTVDILSGAIESYRKLHEDVVEDTKAITEGLESLRSKTTSIREELENPDTEVVGDFEGDLEMLHAELSGRAYSLRNSLLELIEEMDRVDNNFRPIEEPEEEG